MQKCIKCNIIRHYNVMKTTECKNLKCQKRRSIMVMSARQIGHRLLILSRCAGRPNHTIAGLSAHYYYTFFSTLLLRDRELHYVMFRYPYTWCSRVFQSCLFHPWNFGPAFSGPAISTHAIWSHVFQSRVFHSRVFSRSLRITRWQRLRIHRDGVSIVTRLTDRQRRWR